MKRREFIKNSCTLCIGIIGISSVALIANSCSSISYIKINELTKEIVIPLHSFSVEKNVVVLTHKDLEYDIAVILLPNGLYKALEMKCTHQPNPVILTNDKFQCPTHGSSFSLDGSVLKSPASQSLKSFKTSIQETNLIIQL